MNLRTHSFSGINIFSETNRRLFSIPFTKIQYFSLVGEKDNSWSTTWGTWCTSWRMEMPMSCNWKKDL